jgi:hypothetical protein
MYSEEYIGSTNSHANSATGSAGSPGFGIEGALLSYTPPYDATIQLTLTLKAEDSVPAGCYVAIASYAAGVSTPIGVEQPVNSTLSPYTLQFSVAGVKGASHTWGWGYYPAGVGASGTITYGDVVLKMEAIKK